MINTENVISPNHESLSDLKLRIQERRNEALCKYCIKSLIRMKSNICKRCIRNKPKLQPIGMPVISKPKNVDPNAISQSLKNKLFLLDTKASKVPTRTNTLIKQKPIDTNELIALIKRRVAESKLHKKQHAGIVQMKNPQLFNKGGEMKENAMEPNPDSDSVLIKIPLASKQAETDLVTSFVTEAMKSDKIHNLPKGTTISQLLKQNLFNKETISSERENYSNTDGSQMVSNSELDVTPTMSLKDLQLISTKLKNTLPVHDQDGTITKNARPKRLKIIHEPECEESEEYLDTNEPSSQDDCVEPESDFHFLGLPINHVNQFNPNLKSSDENLNFNSVKPTISVASTGSKFGENFEKVFTELYKPNPTVANDNSNNNIIDNNENNFKENLLKLHSKLHEISAEDLHSFENDFVSAERNVVENIKTLLDKHGIHFSDLYTNILRENNSKSKSHTKPFYQDILGKLSDVLHLHLNSNDNNLDLNQSHSNTDTIHQFLQPTYDPYLSTSNNYQLPKSTRSVDVRRTFVQFNNDKTFDNESPLKKTAPHDSIPTLIRPFNKISEQDPNLTFDGQKTSTKEPEINSKITSENPKPFNKNPLRDSTITLDNQTPLQETLERNLDLIEDKNSQNESDIILNNEYWSNKISKNSKHNMNQSESPERIPNVMEDQIALDKIPQNEPNINSNIENSTDKIPKQDNNSKQNTNQGESNEEFTRPNIFKYINNQHFRNRMTYLKHPRLKATNNSDSILKAVQEHPVYTHHKLSIFDNSITTEKVTHLNKNELKSVTKSTFDQTKFSTVSPVTDLDRVTNDGIVLKKSQIHRMKTKHIEIPILNQSNDEIINDPKENIIESKFKNIDTLNNGMRLKNDFDVKTKNNSIESLLNPYKDLNEKIIELKLKKDSANKNSANKALKHISKNKLADTINSTPMNVVNELDNNVSTKTINQQTDEDIFKKNFNMYPIINDSKYEIVLPLLRKGSEDPFVESTNVINLGNEQQEIHNEENHLQTSQNNVLPHQYNNNNFDMLTLNTALATGLINTSSNDSNILSDHIQFAENKINLPLVLKQNDDGTFQLILDKSRMCNCPHCNCTNDCASHEKNTLENSTPFSNMKPNQKAVFKRKTDDSKLHIFNIIGKDNSKSQPDISWHLLKNSHSNSKETYYKNLINNKLFEFFDSLNIPVKNTKQLQVYIDNLPNKEKYELEKYILNQIINTDDNFNNKQKRNKISLLGEPHPHIWDKVKHSRDIYEPATKTSNNRIHFNIQKDANDLESNEHTLKSLLQNEIKKVLQQTNVCSLCKNTNCIHDNHIINNSNERKIVEKRHENIITDDSSNDFSDGIPRGLIKQKYRIVNNLLNWARDVFVNDTKYSD